MNDLLIATNNAGKLAEFERLLADAPIALRDLSYYDIADEAEETGETFAENAAIKAVYYARLSGVLAIADDSGLVIDHLNGEPGVHSARYAGENASTAARIEKVLSQMRDAQGRKARFVCVCTLADRDGSILNVTEGVCEGSIALEPRGANGFGYDPIFIPAEFDITFGELDPNVKHSISHRARAVKKMIPFLQGFFEI